MRCANAIETADSAANAILKPYRGFEFLSLRQLVSTTGKMPAFCSEIRETCSDSIGRMHVPGGHKHWSGGDKKEGALFYTETSGKFDLIPTK
jgi:hypothetical protein